MVLRSLSGRRDWFCVAWCRVHLRAACKDRPLMPIIGTGALLSLYLHPDFITRCPIVCLCCFVKADMWRHREFLSGSKVAPRPPAPPGFPAQATWPPLQSGFSCPVPPPPPAPSPLPLHRRCHSIWITRRGGTRRLGHLTGLLPQSIGRVPRPRTPTLCDRRHIGTQAVQLAGVLLLSIGCQVLWRRGPTAPFSMTALHLHL